MFKTVSDLKKKEDTLSLDYRLAWQLQADEYIQANKRLPNKLPSFLPQKEVFGLYHFRTPREETLVLELQLTKGDGDCFFHAVNKEGFNRKSLIKKLLSNAVNEKVREIFSHEIRQFLYIGYNAAHEREAENKACNLLLTEEIKGLFLSFQNLENIFSRQIREVRETLGEKVTKGKNPDELLKILESNANSSEFHKKDVQEASFFELLNIFKNTYQALIDADKMICKYCCREDVFREYVRRYLKDAKGFIPFSRDFGVDLFETTVDVINRLFQMNIQVFLPSDKNHRELKLVNLPGSGGEIFILHDGYSHFSGLKARSSLKPELSRQEDTRIEFDIPVDENISKKKPASNKKRMILNKYTGFMVFWIVVSVSLKSSSIVWLYELLEGGATGIYIYVYLGLLIGTYVFGNVPDIAIDLNLELAQSESERIYVETISKEYSSLPQLMLDKNFRKEQESFLTTESRKIFKEVLVSSSNGINSTLSVLADTITMSVIISPWYGLGYLGSMLIYGAGTVLINKKVESLSSADLLKAKELSNILNVGWDNIVVGNKYSNQLWLQSFNEKLVVATQTGVTYVKFVKISSSILSLASILPIVGITSWLVAREVASVDAIALLVAVVPRQLETVQHLNKLSSSYARWMGGNEKLRELRKYVDNPRERNEPDYQIQYKQISFFDKSNTEVKCNSVKEFLEMVSNTRTGKITIRGDNGKGKSVLMCKLHCHLLAGGNESFYLPAKSSLYFKSLTEGLSSGQKAIAEINEVIDNQNVKYLLLDEWDANLDQNNTLLMSKLLEKVSQDRCVIEIRHKKDQLDQIDTRDGSISLFEDGSMSSIPIIFSYNKSNSLKQKSMDSASFQEEINEKTKLVPQDKKRCHIM